MNINLSASLAKQVAAMLNYYGGLVCDEVSEGCTHAFSIEYDANTRHLHTTNSAVKIVTPDWLGDCIDKNQLVDELKYNPKYLETNAENKEILEQLATAAKEASSSLINAADSTPMPTDTSTGIEMDSNGGKIATLNSPTPKSHKISLNTHQLNSTTKQSFTPTYGHSPAGATYTSSSINVTNVNNKTGVNGLDSSSLNMHDQTNQSSIVYAQVNNTMPAISATNIEPAANPTIATNASTDNLTHTSSVEVIAIASTSEGLSQMIF